MRRPMRQQFDTSARALCEYPLTASYADYRHATMRGGGLYSFYGWTRVSLPFRARMTGVRGSAFICKSKPRSEKLPLKLDLDNTSERTCMLYPFSFLLVGCVWLCRSGLQADATDCVSVDMRLLLAGFSGSAGALHPVPSGIVGTAYLRTARHLFGSIP